MHSELSRHRHKDCLASVAGENNIAFVRLKLLQERIFALNTNSGKDAEKCGSANKIGIIR